MGENLGRESDMSWMLVTVSPCAVKGAMYDWLRDAIERRGIDRERLTIDHRKLLPLLASKAQVLPTWGIDLLPADVSLFLGLSSSTLHRRHWSGCIHHLVLFNSNLVFPTYVVLRVSVCICVYARLSFSLSISNLTCLPVVSRLTWASDSSPHLLDSLVQDLRGPARLLRIREDGELALPM